MVQRVELYDGYYGSFAEDVSNAVRRETWGEDIGQSSWVTVDEYRHFLPWLDLAPDRHLLEVGSGSGGPAIFVAREISCRVTGIDSNENGVANAITLAADAGLSERVDFQAVDATGRLPFDDDTFDAILSIDAMCHLTNRLDVLKEWRRVLRPGGRGLYTDPVVITGAVTFEELSLRSSIGQFLFMPPGENERLIEAAGLRLIKQEDASRSTATVSARWRDARENHKADLIEMEGEDGFAGLQKFFDTVHRVTSEGRLSRFFYLVEK